jgi:Domain of unknown function (DUF427)
LSPVTGVGVRLSPGASNPCKCGPTDGAEDESAGSAISEIYRDRAEWWSVRANGSVHADLAWSYRNPLPESQKIAGLVAFYNEKVDIYVDGALQERPHTKFS